MSTLTIRGCRIGAGRPKVIIPLVERTEAEVRERAARFAPMRADCVEWRADCFEAANDAAAVQRCLRTMREALGQKLLLATLRTKAEGGAKAFSQEQYAAFCRAVCASGCADLLDIELLPTGSALPELIDTAHASGVRVICSSHDFTKTPPRDEMVARMVRMQAAGADIAKLAVMPQNRTDVAELLAATAEMTERHPQTPVITMSMGALGAVSRVCGEAFGSAMTFASAGKASAPGQIELEALNGLLDALYGQSC